MTTKQNRVPALLAGLWVLLLFGAPAGADQVYRWKDGQGEWHYAQQPPAGVDFETIPVATPQRAAGQTAAKGPDAAAPAPGEGAAADLEPTAQTQMSAQELQALMQKNCEAARHNLEVTQSRTRVLIPEKDGSMRQLTDEERLAAIEQAQKDIEQYCP